MTLSHLVIILVATLLGGGVAGLLWLVVNRLTDGAARGPQDLPEPPETPTVPLFPDPSLSAHVAAIRDDLDKLAQSHLALMSGMKNWENQLLAEMRAIASASDPEVLILLNRIAAQVGADPVTRAPPQEEADPPAPAAPQAAPDQDEDEQDPDPDPAPDPDLETEPPERPAQQA